MLKQIEAGVLRIGYLDSGPSEGTPVLLLHGFPYDVQAYEAVGPLLVAGGCRAIIPYLRGYGPTRFLSEETPRSGQQAVLAHDLLALMDALGISSGNAPASGRITLSHQSLCSPMASMSTCSTCPGLAPRTATGPVHM